MGIFLPMSPRGCDRVARLRASRRRAGADLLRLRRSGDRVPPGRRRSEGADHGGRLAPAGRDRADEGDRATRRSPTRRRSSTSSPGRRLGLDVPPSTAATTTGRTLVADAPGELAPFEVESEHPYLIAYTSGTTGRPKGALHVHGGFLLSIAREAAYQADLRAGDRVLFATDMGWIMGPWTVVGAGALGATIVFMEGAPDWPADRLWQLVESERVTMLGVSPTLVRALIPKGEPHRRPLLPARGDDDRRAVEPRPVRLARRARLRRRPHPDREHLGRHRGRRVLPRGHADGADEAVLARLPGARAGHGRASTTTAGLCAGRSGSSSAGGPGRG